LHAGAAGYVLSQIRVMPEDRDPQLSAVMREDAIAAILADGPPQPTTSGLPGRAVALREALLADADGELTSAEKAMMAEWLNRLADRA
jgi:hypothetical protein